MEKVRKEFRVGEKASIKQRATDETVNLYAVVSGDYNKIHLDEDYAAKSVFGKRIVHGLFCQGMVSNVIGNILPGTGSIFVSESIFYKRPVYIGDEIICEVKITQILTENKLELSFSCIRADAGAEIVIEGTAIVKVIN